MEGVVEVYGLLMQSVAYEGADMPAAQIKQADAQVGEKFKSLRGAVASIKASHTGQDDLTARLAAVEDELGQLERHSLQAIDLKSVA